MITSDEARLERAIGTHQASVYRTAYNYTLNRMDAEDITQEVFIRYLARAPEFRDGEHEKAWRLRVTVNLCKALRRSAWFRKRAPLVACEAPADDRHPVFESVKQLKPMYRITVYMYYYEGYSVGEIARITGASETAVQSRLHRARQTLREILEGES